MIGTALGRYKLLEPLGEGGMGRVFLAEDPSLARRIAIKVLPPEFAADKERRERLLHEARAASALNHPNIVTVYDVGDENGNLFVAMERVEGVSLRDWSAQGRSPAEVLAIARQAARALGVAHAAGLVHRDLKPENLMVRGDGLLKILDFGLARSVAPGGDATMTMPGTILGTAPYMSPEQVLGQPAGPASDVFSLGTLLYEMLTARHPFAAATAVDTMHRILHETPPAPSSIAPALPAALDFVLAKALAKEPARRYANARDLDVDLEAVEPKLAAPATTQAPKAKGPRAIAVLPFKNIGGSVDLDYLGVGLADAVITRLASSPDLVVRATSSIARYDKQAVDPLHIARELDVATVLDASFQRAGDRFRATARLVEAPGGQALWAGKIDLKFEDIFDVQDEVALGIANALTARLAKKDFTPSPEAYELYLRSRDAVRFARKEKFIEAMAWLERTVTIEPRYADAWALLGQFRHAMADSGIDPDPRWFAQGEAAFTRALELDPDNFEAQFGMGTLAIVRGQKREAYRRFATVHRIAPNHYPVTHYLAYLYRLCDMWPQFYAAEERAIELDPSQPYPHWAVTRSHLEFRRVEEGRKSLARLRARFPDDERFFALEALAREAEGFPGEAVALLEEHRGRSGFDVVEEEMLAGFLAANGEGERALAVLRPLAQATWTDMDFAAWAASIHGQLGQADEAFRFLARATELGNDSLSLFESKWHFGALHGDPRWPEFIAGVRERVAAYQREFTWPPA